MGTHSIVVIFCSRRGEEGEGEGRGPGEGEGRGAGEGGDAGEGGTACSLLRFQV